MKKSLQNPVQGEILSSSQPEPGENSEQYCGAWSMLYTWLHYILYRYSFSSDTICPGFLSKNVK